MTMTEQFMENCKTSPAYNRRLAKVAVQCSEDTFVVNQSLVLLINICGENRHLRQAPKRCTTFKKMRKALIIFILILNYQSSFGQTYLTSEVIDKAEYYLKEAVGDSLFKYFKLGPNSYYEYQTKSGKSKWKEISK